MSYSPETTIGYIGYNHSDIDDRCLKVDPLNRTRPNSRPFVRDFSYFLVVITIIYVFFSLSRFYYYQKVYVRLQKRSFLMIVVAGCGALCQVLGNSLWLATDYVCWVKVVLFMFVVPFLAMSLPIRMLDFYNRHVFARRLLIALRENEQKANEAFIASLESKEKGEASTEVVVVSMQNQRGSTKIAGISVRSLKILKFLTSVYMKLILIILLLTPNLLSLAYDFSTTPHLNPSAACRGCYVSLTTFLVLLIGGAGMTILGIILVVIVRKYPDPFGLLPEMALASVFGGLVAVVGFICDNMFSGGTHFTFGWVIYFGCIAILFIVSDYQIILAKRYETPIQKNSQGGQNESAFQHENPPSSHGPNDVSLITPEHYHETEKLSTGKLKKLLENRVIVEYFEEHLVAEFSVELIRMYLECQTFKKNFADLTEKTRKARAKRIVETYVVDTSLSQVNLSDALRNKIIEEIQSDSLVSFDIFKESDSEILKMMLGAYQRFMKTKNFEVMLEKIKDQQRAKVPSKPQASKADTIARSDSRSLTPWASSKA